MRGVPADQHSASAHRRVEATGRTVLRGEPVLPHPDGFERGPRVRRSTGGARRRTPARHFDRFATHLRLATPYLRGQDQQDPPRRVAPCKASSGSGFTLPGCKPLAYRSPVPPPQPGLSLKPCRLRTSSHWAAQAAAFSNRCHPRPNHDSSARFSSAGTPARRCSPIVLAGPPLQSTKSGLRCPLPGVRRLWRLRHPRRVRDRVSCRRRRTP